MQNRSEHITRRYAFASKNSSSSFRRRSLPTWWRGEAGRGARWDETRRGGKNGKFNEQHIRLYLERYVMQYRSVRELKVCKYRLIGEACTRGSDMGAQHPAAVASPSVAASNGKACGLQAALGPSRRDALRETPRG